jgi:enoyl-CoA hydratase
VSAAEPRVKLVLGDGPVATILIDREKALNALDAQTLDELEGVVRHVAGDDAIRGALLVGQGEKAFVAGADLKQLAEVRKEGRGADLARRGQAVLRAIETCPRPIIACVNGFALGGGLELALACHFRYATRNAKLGLPEVGLGLIPGYGGTQRLPRLVGRGLGTELVLTGEPIDAAEALRIGLVNKVFETRADLLAAATKTIRTIAARGPRAIALALEAIDRGADRDLGDALGLEADLFGRACANEESGEGIAAFLEKRPAAFK